MRAKELQYHAPARRVEYESRADSDLVRGYLEGDERSFTELARRYETRLLNFIFRVIGDREKAEDLVQETFLRVHRHLARFNQTKKFSTWLYVIASNLAKNELRNLSRNRLVLFQALESEGYDEPLFEDSRGHPDREYHKRHLREIVEDTVAEMSEPHREVFVLREIAGKTYDEITEITGINPGTVKSRLNRARTTFAALIGPKID